MKFFTVGINLTARPGAGHFLRKQNMKGLIFITVFAAFFTFLACDYLDTPVVYQSYSTRAIKGWEDRSGYHSCGDDTPCGIPESYDLVWVK